MKFYQDKTSYKKVMAVDNSGTKAVLSASPGPNPERCEPQLFLASLGQVRTGVNYCFSSTVGRTLSKFGFPQTCVQFSNSTLLETLRPSEVVEMRFVTLHLA